MECEIFRIIWNAKLIINQCFFNLHNCTFNGFSKENLAPGKWTILGPKMMRPCNFGWVLSIFLFCTIKGAKRHMKVLLMVLFKVLHSLNTGSPSLLCTCFLDAWHHAENYFVKQERQIIKLNLFSPATFLLPLKSFNWDEVIILSRNQLNWWSSWIPLGIYLIKVNKGNTKTKWNLFKGNNKGTRIR